MSATSATGLCSLADGSLATCVNVTGAGAGSAGAPSPAAVPLSPPTAAARAAPARSPSPSPAAYTAGPATPGAGNGVGAAEAAAAMLGGMPLCSAEPVAGEWVDSLQCVEVCWCHAGINAAAAQVQLR